MRNVSEVGRLFLSLTSVSQHNRNVEEADRVAGYLSYATRLHVTSANVERSATHGGDELQRGAARQLIVRNLHFILQLHRLPDEMLLVHRYPCIQPASRMQA